MNENKTAITEMREYAESWLDSGTEYSRGQIIEAMVNKARALEASQAGKGKRLVEELREYLGFHYSEGHTNGMMIMSDCLQILSRHKASDKGVK